MTVAEVIARHRAEKDWTVYRLAKEAETTPAYIADIEAGRKMPGLAIAARIAAALGISLAEFEQCFQSPEK